MCYINARSVQNKTLVLNDFIQTNNLDIFAISETWLNPGAPTATYINALLPPGYSIYHVDRDTDSRGGGVAVIYRTCMRMKQSVHNRLTQFEYIQCTLNINNKKLIWLFSTDHHHRDLHLMI